MKKTILLAAFAALISLASCQKEDVIDNGTDSNVSPVFTASISGATKTTVSLTDGKVAWEAGDEITVIDASKSSAVYKIESIDGTTGKATFVIKDGETALGNGPYTATYGNEPATAQVYSATAGKLYMTAPATSGNSFEFTVQCGLMKINLTKTGESVKSIAVTGTPTGGTETTYTLTCTEAQSIASAKDFFIALPAGSYTKIEITDSDSKVCALNSSTSVAVVANHIKPVTFVDGKLIFITPLPNGALPGEFSVSTSKTVHFSQGNLFYDGSTFKFETNQYDSRNYWDNSHVSHFFWGTAAEISFAESYNESVTVDDVFFTNVTEETANPDFTVVGVSGKYRMLSQTEWKYLVKNHNGKRITVCGITGYAIAPDGVSANAIASSYADDTSWKAAQDAGIVFLPAAGRRDANLNIASFGDDGRYWTSTTFSNGYAYAVTFPGEKAYDFSGRDCGVGISVRLVVE